MFGWEDPEVEPPAELLVLWSRACTGANRIDIRRLLEMHPRIRGIPVKAPENNLRSDRFAKTDKILKVTQQSLLHILRVFAQSITPSSSMETQLQLWQYTAELYHKLLLERKELAVPGLAVGDSQDCLFTKEDVNNFKNQRSVLALQQPSMGLAQVSFWQSLSCCCRAAGKVLQRKGLQALWSKECL